MQSFKKKTGKPRLQLAMLGALTVAPLLGTVATSQADAPDRDRTRNERDDYRTRQRNNQHQGNRRNDNDRDDARDGNHRGNGAGDRADNRNGNHRAGSYNGRNNGGYNGSYNNNGGYYPNGGYPNDGYNGGYNNGYYPNGGYNNGSGFTGTVTNVRSDESFDIRIAGDTYNVYTDSRLSRRLNEGDLVRVFGQRVGKNDIRNARVMILNNR